MALTIRLGLAGVALILTVSCGARSSPTTQPDPPATRSPTRVTSGFSAAPGFVIERDVQYEAAIPHCVLRIARAVNPEGVAAYIEVPMTWCAGIE